MCLVTSMTACRPHAGHALDEGACGIGRGKMASLPYSPTSLRKAACHCCSYICLCFLPCASSWSFGLTARCNCCVIRNLSLLARGGRRSFHHIWHKLHLDPLHTSCEWDSHDCCHQCSPPSCCHIPRNFGHFLLSSRLQRSETQLLNSAIHSQKTAEMNTFSNQQQYLHFGST